MCFYLQDVNPSVPKTIYKGDLCKCHSVRTLRQSFKLIGRVAIGQQEVYKSERRKYHSVPSSEEDEGHVLHWRLSQFLRFLHKDTNGADQSNVGTPCHYIANRTIVNTDSHLIVSRFNHNREHSKHTIIKWSLKSWFVINTAERNCRRQFQDLLLVEIIRAQLFHTVVWYTRQSFFASFVAPINIF